MTGLQQHLARALARARAPLAMGLGLMAGVIAGCMTSVSIPPQYRFSCDKDEDCQVLVDEETQETYREKCISGLCQFPCEGSLLTEIADECPPNDYLGCFNGVCTHLCSTDTKLCPSPQTCIQLEVPAGFESAVPDGIDLEQTGLCGIKCDAEGAPSCPDGQLCLEGVCLGFGSGSGSDASTTGGQDTDTDTDTDTGGGT